MQTFYFQVILLPFLNSHAPAATHTETLLVLAGLFLECVFRAMIQQSVMTAEDAVFLDNGCRKILERMLELIMKRTP